MHADKSSIKSHWGSAFIISDFEKTTPWHVLYVLYTIIAINTRGICVVHLYSM